MTDQADIRKSLGDLAAEAQGIRREIQRVNRLTWLVGGAAVLIIAFTIAVGFHVVLDNQRSIEENNRRWCPLVGLLVARPSDPPPTTERGRLIAERAAGLSNQFHCTGE